MKLLLLIFTCINTIVYSQNNTDVSLFMKKQPDKQLTEVFSESGDMYKTLGHHGHAIENEFLGFRIYFDYKAAIDIYSKTKPGLELAKTKWYTSPELQKQGWGVDNYKVGETVGLGGVRLPKRHQKVNMNLQCVLENTCWKSVIITGKLLSIFSISR